MKIHFLYPKKISSALKVYFDCFLLGEEINPIPFRKTWRLKTNLSSCEKGVILNKNANESQYRHDSRKKTNKINEYL